MNKLWKAGPETKGDTTVSIHVPGFAIGERVPLIIVLESIALTTAPQVEESGKNNHNAIDNVTIEQIANIVEWWLRWDDYKNHNFTNAYF